MRAFGIVVRDEAQNEHDPECGYDEHFKINLDGISDKRLRAIEVAPSKGGDDDE